MSSSSRDFEHVASALERIGKQLSGLLSKSDGEEKRKISQCVRIISQRSVLHRLQDHLQEQKSLLRYLDAHCTPGSSWEKDAARRLSRAEMFFQGYAMDQSGQRITDEGSVICQLLMRRVSGLSGPARIAALEAAAFIGNDIAPLDTIMEDWNVDTGFEEKERVFRIGASLGCISYRLRLAALLLPISSDTSLDRDLSSQEHEGLQLLSEIANSAFPKDDIDEMEDHARAVLYLAEWHRTRGNVRMACHFYEKVAAEASLDDTAVKAVLEHVKLIQSPVAPRSLRRRAVAIGVLEGFLSARPSADRSGEVRVVLVKLLLEEPDPDIVRVRDLMDHSFTF